ncbi:MAG: Uma2 family endonuclease [Gemmataceae bacterium]
MPATAPPRLMTTEELLAMPDDGVERWLVRGQLREAKPDADGNPVTVRNRDHSFLMTRVARFLDAWLDTQPEPRGVVVCGEAGLRLRQTHESTVGVDVAYISAAVAARRTADTSLIDGAPVLAAEILSPSDTVEDINEKIDEYLTAGTALVWVIDPHRRTVTVHRPGHEPELVNVRQELSAEPELPGFRVAAARLFP